MTTWIFIGGVLLVGLVAGAGIALLYVTALNGGEDADGPDEEGPRW